MILASAALLLAGCSGAEDKAGEERPATAGPTVASPPAAEGRGPAVAPSPLSGAEIEQAKLAGELGCSFSTTDSAPILVAMGNVASPAPAQGVVKVDGKVERVAAAGGFDAMLRGVTFSGAGGTFRVALTGPATGGGESPPRPAALTYDRADGASLTLAGHWTCGP